MIFHAQVSSSSAMEPFACKTLLVFLIESFHLKIHSLTTDRSSNIKQMMVGDDRLKHVKHCYDVWHLIKRYLFRNVIELKNDVY